jgi:glutamyl-tRNA synthetase
VEGARQQFGRVFHYFDVDPDEDDPAGAYGPYAQSRRAPIYHSYVRDLVRRGLAYPCFCSREDLARTAAEQQAAKATPGYYGPWARCQDLPDAEVRTRLEHGQPFTIRFRAPDGGPSRVVFDDLIRGRLELADNRNDIVLLKTPDRGLHLPTYHLAYVVVDHLMRVTVVIRGEEWISSVPVHLQLGQVPRFL